MKKLLLLACLMVALAPQGVKADDGSEPDDGAKNHLKASELAGIGIGGAALVGVAGYLLLRRRHSA